MKPVTINGKFLSAEPTGVHRVAGELLAALDRRWASQQQPAPLATLLLPRNAHRVPALQHIGVRIVGGPVGPLWEQTALPVAARGSCLLSLCNLAPLVTLDGLTLVHDAQVHSSPASYSPAFRLWYRALQPLIARRQGGLLTVSEFSREQLARYGVCPAGKTRIVHNGCDHLDDVTADEGVLDRLALRGRPFLLAPATTLAHKNIQVLLKAWGDPRLSGVTLVLYGSSSAEDFRRRGHVVPEAVRFSGRISDSELVALMRAALAFGFPSRTEGFGLPPLEAMRARCPTIVAPCGALPEVCGDAAIYVDPDDSAGWVRAVLALTGDAALRASRVRDGQSQSDRYSWDAAAGCLAGLLEAR